MSLLRLEGGALPFAVIDHGHVIARFATEAHALHFIAALHRTQEPSAPMEN